MNEISIREKVFNFLVKELSFLDNNYDRLVYPNIKESVILDLKRFHSLDTSTKIIYFRDINPDKSCLTRLVISDIGISFRRSYKFLFREVKISSWDILIKWEEINHIEYSEEKKAFYIYLDEENKQYYCISRRDLLKKENTSTCMKVAEILTQAANIFVGVDQLIDKVFELESNNKFDEALLVVDDLFKKVDLVEEAAPFLHYVKGRVLVNSFDYSDDADDEQTLDSGQHELELALNSLGDEWKDYEYIICYYLSLVYSYHEDYLKSRDFLIRCMGTDGDSLFSEAKAGFQACESELKNLWMDYTSKIKYADRQFIMPVNEIKGCYDELIKTFLIKNIPSCIKFPVGHPVSNELYMGHPYNSDLYIPYDNADETLFMDKVNELCYLLQCLGATEISIQSVKGKSVTEIQKKQLNNEGFVNYKMVSGDINVDSKVNSNKNSNFSSHIELKQQFSPTQKPFVPEGLVWFPQEIQWQRLANSRLKGNLLEHSEVISTNDTHFVSSSLENELRLHIKALIAKVNVASQTASSYELKQLINTEWRIIVKFKSIEEFD